MILEGKHNNLIDKEKSDLALRQQDNKTGKIKNNISVIQDTTQIRQDFSTINICNTHRNRNDKAAKGIFKHFFFTD